MPSSCALRWTFFPARHAALSISSAIAQAATASSATAIAGLHGEGVVLGRVKGAVLAAMELAAFRPPEVDRRAHPVVAGLLQLRALLGSGPHLPACFLRS